MDEGGEGAVTDRIPANIRIVDLATRRRELALNCRFRSVCYARSKNCYICPRRGGVQYILRNSEGGFDDGWEVFKVSGAYRSAGVNQVALPSG